MKSNKILIMGLTVMLGAATGISVVAADSEKSDTEKNVIVDIQDYDLDEPFTIPEGAVMLEVESDNIDETQKEEEVPENTATKDDSVDIKLTMSGDEDMPEIPKDAILLEEQIIEE